MASSGTSIYISWDKLAYVLEEEYRPTDIRSKAPKNVIKNITNAVSAQTTGLYSLTFIHSAIQHISCLGPMGQVLC